MKINVALINKTGQIRERHGDVLMLIGVRNLQTFSVFTTLGLVKWR